MADACPWCGHKPASRAARTATTVTLSTGRTHVLSTAERKYLAIAPYFSSVSLGLTSTLDVMDQANRLEQNRQRVVLARHKGQRAIINERTNTVERWEDAA